MSAVNLSIAIQRLQADWDLWCEDYIAKSARIRRLEEALMDCRMHCIHEDGNPWERIPDIVDAALDPTT